MVSLRTVENLEMSHVGLGTLDEYSLMVLFGNAHSRHLVRGLSHNASQIVDVQGQPLYPAYFMTHLQVPPSTPLAAFCLWGQVAVESELSRYGDTILESAYTAGPPDGSASAPITMRANSLFIPDPAAFPRQPRRAAVPREGTIAALRKVTTPPTAIQEASRVRAAGFGHDGTAMESAEPFRYLLENGRDVAAGHPMIFAKIPQLAELCERQFLREMTGSRISEDILQAVSLLSRKTFYYGNAYAGDRLALHTRARVAACKESLWLDNPRLQYLFRISCETEMYGDRDLIAIMQSEKVIVHSIGSQSLVQDTKRLLGPLSN